VVATAVGGVAEQITADCGRVVRPRDPDALGAAILDVLGDMDVCQALSTAARERAANLFGIDRFRATHRAIYEVVLGSRPGQSSAEDAVAPADVALEQAEMELANA
jgi:glycosyltransferase involved in cell wall biosynthesis